MAKIIKIGNSKGVLIPKVLPVMRIIPGLVVILTFFPKPLSSKRTLGPLEKVLAKDWLRSEEDEAWGKL